MEIESKPIRQADPMMTDLRKRLKGYLKRPNLTDLWSIIGELGPDPSFYHEEPDYPESESSSLSESESDETMAKRANQSRNKRDTPFGRKLQLEYQKRRLFTNLLAWAVPSPEAIATIQQFVGSTPILEIGSGRGLWAHLLQLNQVSVIPTDQTPRQMTFTQIESIDATAAVEKYLQPGGCLMTCWPDGLSSYATDAVKRGLDKGLLEKVIYIGEPRDGCTGDDEFHAIMEKQFTLVQQVKITQWWGIHDDLRLYQRQS
jgi:hypothetical protein